MLGWLAAGGFGPAVRAAEDPGAGTDAERPPETPAELAEAGEGAFLDGRFEEAERHFARLVEEFRGSAEVAEAVARAVPVLALCRVRLGRLAGLDPLIDEALALGTTTAEQGEELRFWKGVAALEERRFDDAQRALGEFHAEKSHDAVRRTEALVLFGTADVMRGEWRRAADFFRARLPGLAERDADAYDRVAVLLLHALIEAGDLAGALGHLVALAPRMDELTQLVALQSSALRLGSGLLEAGDFHGAITCLQGIWPRRRLLERQRERLDEVRDRIAGQAARGGADPLEHLRLEGALRRLEREIARFEGTADFDASVRLRLAEAWRQLGRFRAAGLVLEGVADSGETRPELAAAAGLGAIECWTEVGRWARVAERAEAFGGRFAGVATPEQAAAAAFLHAEAVRESGNLEEAERRYAEVVERFPDSPLAGTAAFMEAMTALLGDRFAVAIERFRGFREERPGDRLAGDALYWEALGRSMHGEHQGAFEQMGEYVRRFPKGRYVRAAEFRQAFSKFALAWYDEAIERFERFLEREPDAAQADEARLLLGDALGAVGETDRAVEAYRSIRREAGGFFEEGWFKTGKIHRLTGEVGAARAHFERFLEVAPRSPRVAEALLEIGRLDRLSGDIGAARDVWWDAVRRLGNDPAAVAVEDVLDNLHRLGRAGGTDEGGDGHSLVLGELDRIRREAREAGRETLVLRCLWARARVLAERAPDMSHAALLETGTIVDPSRHPVRIVVDSADARRTGDKPLTAAELYRDARRWNPRTLERDRIAFGLGELARADGRWLDALEQFREAERRSWRPDLGARAVLRQAEMQAAMDLRSPALETLESLLGSPSVPARFKAEGLLAAATLVEEDGRERAALAYCERVYVAYGKFLDLVAAAYWRRGCLLEKLDLPVEALEVYRELARRADLADLPESRQAAARIAAMTRPASGGSHEPTAE